MITEMPCEYYIVRIKDWQVRVGFHGGTKDEHCAFLTLMGTDKDHPVADIAHIGDLLLPLKSDIDQGVGIGTRKHGDATVVTVKHCQQMITIKQQHPKPFLQQQREMIVSTKRAQGQLLDRKKDVESRRISKIGSETSKITSAT